MAHITPPPPEQLPTSRQLRWGALAVVAGAVLLTIVVVLPAERAIDVTGLGRVIGLTEMGEIKQEVNAQFVAQEIFRAEGRVADSIQAAEESAAMRAIASGVVPARTDTTRLTVGGGEARTVRLQMSAKAWTVFSWSTDRGGLNDDVRGDSSSAPLAPFFRYRGGRDRTADSGAIVAKFDGLHGWLWWNETDSSTTVTLVTRGNYSAIVVSPRGQ